MQKTKSLLINYLGTTAKNSLPAGYAAGVDKASKAMEEKYPKIEGVKIQGSKPHVSSRDPSDKQEVITLSYHTASGTRVTSVHLHEDQSFKEYPSRNASKGK